jgi:hypothetical protein
MDAQDEKFLKNWSKTLGKGKALFLTKGALGAAAVAVLAELFAKHELPYSEILLSYQLLFKVVVYALIGAVSFNQVWKRNTKRYAALQEEAS